MKKLLLFLSAVSAVFLFNSCGNEEANLEPKLDEVYVEQQNDFLKIKNNITELDKTYRLKKYASVEDGTYANETRGFLGRLWKRIVAVFKADAKGFVGNKTQSTRGLVETVCDKVANAVIASIDCIVNSAVGDDAVEMNAGQRKVSAAYQSVSPVNSAEVALDSTVIFKRTEILEGYEQQYVAQEDSAGYYHNAVIIDVFKTIGSVDELAEKSDEELLKIVNSSVEHVFGLPVGSLQYDTRRNEAILENMKNGKLDLSYVDEGDEEIEELMDVIDTYLTGIPDDFDQDSDWTEYSKGVVDIIDKSNLREGTKGRLRSMLTVAFASSKLWNIEMLKIMYDEK